MSLHSFILIFTLSFSPFLDCTAAARQWVSDDDKFRVQAELVGFDGFVVETQKVVRLGKLLQKRARELVKARLATTSDIVNAEYFRFDNEIQQLSISDHR